MNKKVFGQWTDMRGFVPQSYCENSAIYCSICGYEIWPSVYKFKKDGVMYGRLDLPKRCNYCNAIMLSESVKL